MADKVRELAEKLTINMHPGRSDDWKEFRKLHDEFERILRAELEPLLDAAYKVVTYTDDIPGSMHKWLAAELAGWRKEKP